MPCATIGPTTGCHVFWSISNEFYDPVHTSGSVWQNISADLWLQLLFKNGGVVCTSCFSLEKSSYKTSFLTNVPWSNFALKGSIREPLIHPENSKAISFWVRKYSMFCFQHGFSWHLAGYFPVWRNFLTSQVRNFCVVTCLAVLVE